MTFSNEYSTNNSSIYIPKISKTACCRNGLYAVDSKTGAFSSPFKDGTIFTYKMLFEFMNNDNYTHYKSHCVDDSYHQECSVCFVGFTLAKVTKKYLSMGPEYGEMYEEARNMARKNYSNSAQTGLEINVPIKSPYGRICQEYCCDNGRTPYRTTSNNKGKLRGVI